MSDEPRFVWLDLEMTGLDPSSCVILQIGVVITGANLVPIAEIERTIWQPDEELARMEPYVREMHARNGLLERVRASTVSLRSAEHDVLALIAGHCRYREPFLAGNSIHQDRRFLIRYMPALEQFLHYRQLDVSSLKILAGAWFGIRFEKQDKTHTALDDVRASIGELAYYRAHLMRER